MSLIHPMCAATLLFALNAATIQPVSARGGHVRVGDAFVRTSDSKTWVIGTNAVQVTYSSTDSGLTLSSFKNNLTKPAREYVSAPSTPFGVPPQPLVGTFTIDTVWTKPLAVAGTTDPAQDHIRLSVKKGDLIGFGTVINTDDGSATTLWTTTLDYGDGTICSSADDTKLDQGPMWFYYTRAPGTGHMELMGQVVAPLHKGQETARIASGFRYPPGGPRIWSKGFQNLNPFELVRVWKAPRDGTVTISGIAKHNGGGSIVHLSIMRIAEKDQQGRCE